MTDFRLAPPDRFTYKKATPAQHTTGLLLVFSLLAVSAMEYFYRSQNYIVIAFCIAALFFFRFRRTLTKGFFLAVSLFFVVESIQYMIFGGFNLRTFFGTYVRLALAFMVVSIVRERFYVYYVRILYFLCIISLIFYLGSFVAGAQSFYLQTLSKLVPNPWEAINTFYKSKPNIVLFTFHDSLFSGMRNSGPFWEPGAFAIFIMLALIFNNSSEPLLKSRKNLVFILTLITTFSTAGYIAFFLFLFYVNFELVTRNVLYVVILAGVIAATVFFYERIPFLKEKIEENISLADETTSSRFGSAIADFEAFKRSPIVGLGRAGAKEGFISEHEFSEENHRNNGVFDLLSKYGLPLFLFYMINIYRSFRNGFAGVSSPRLFSIVAFSIIFLLGFSQGIFLKPFFYAFLFLPYARKTSTKTDEPRRRYSYAQQM